MIKINTILIGLNFFLSETETVDFIHPFTCFAIVISLRISFRVQIYIDIKMF